MLQPTQDAGGRGVESFEAQYAAAAEAELVDVPYAVAMNRRPPADDKAAVVQIEEETPVDAKLSIEILLRLRFIAPGQPKTFPRLWTIKCTGHTSDNWITALPQLVHTGPLPELTEMLTEVGAAGMELTMIARKLSDLAKSRGLVRRHTHDNGSGMSPSDFRIDLLKLKSYLTCYPDRIVVAPKAKTYGGYIGMQQMVDQVWLIGA